MNDDCVCCHAAYTVRAGFDDTGLCDPCAQGEVERLSEVEERLAVAREQLGALKAAARSVLRLLPKRTWPERLTFALKQLEGLVAP